MEDNRNARVIVSVAVTKNALEQSGLDARARGGGYLHLRRRLHL